jgi:TIR domain
MAGPIPAASGRIFISYRREETAYPAAWLFDRLADRFGGRQVFKDVDSIQLGDDFVEVITRAVGSCDVLLAVIGNEWLTITDAHGRRRLDDPDDFVRLEIEAALTRKVRVIPILVDGSRMPRADELPDSLAKLVRRQALELSPNRFELDTSRLLKVLDMTLAEVRTAQEDASSTVAPAGKAPDPTTTEVTEAQEAPERPEQARYSRTPSLAPAAPAPPGGARPASEQGEPPDKLRRRLSTRARILAAATVGVVLLLLISVIVANSQTTPSTTENARDGQGTTSGGIEVDSAPVTSPDEIELTGLRAVSRRDPDPPRVGDTVTVSYSLTNVGDQRIQLEYTFVGVRNPADENRDTEDMNEGRVLAPGETVNAQGRIPLESAGTWQLWPCYVLSGERFCPDKWQVFFVLAK